MYRRLTLDPENEIELWTRNGPCRIQLMSGDITTLPVSEKVDIVMVSAFPGDYAPLSGTVIGALDKNLGISVRSLAYDKEMDLRHLFSCWVSKPIDSEKSPFKKLLCFEKRASMSIVEQVSQMFRVFVPVFNNHDSTVITPLLAAGHQGQSELEICSIMVKAGAHWINAGLPLQCLKIVLYGGVNVQIADMFQTLKKKLLAKNLKLRTQITKKTYDIYVSFHPEDRTKYVGHIVNSLKKEESKIKLFATVIEYDHDSVWQKDIFDAMVSSKRIIVVLTAMFLKSPECLEQYNMALCCNKLMGGHILAPFYLESISSMPSYMSLVQWIDCRERKEGDNTILKIGNACSTVLTSITEKHEDLEVSEGVTKSLAKADKFKYDVFISYSHKNPKEAEMLLKIFGEVDDCVKVFYDRSALTTGSNWQEMLYQCLGLCRCAIALLSPTYLTSTVCMEEYNLALARFLTQDEGMQFLPVWIEKSDTVPVQISAVSIMDAVNDFDQKAHQIAKHVCKFLRDRENMAESTLFPDVPSNYSQNGADLSEAETVVEKLLSSHRSSQIHKQYKFLVKNQEKRDFERVKPLVIPKTEKRFESSPTDVVISFSNDSNYLATIFCTLLEQKCPYLKISINSEQNLERMEALDTASVMVMFISREFLLTDSQMHELHLALTRQRLCEKKIIYLIKTTPLKTVHPFFPRILRYDISMTDSVWEKFEKEFLKGRSQIDNRKMVTVGRSHKVGVARFFSCKFSEYFALTKASDDVLELALDLKEKTKSHGPLLLNLVTVEMEVSGKTDSRDITQGSKAVNSNSHNHTKEEVKPEVNSVSIKGNLNENYAQKEAEKSKDKDEITDIKNHKNFSISNSSSGMQEENSSSKSNYRGNALLEGMAVGSKDNAEVKEDEKIDSVSESENTEIKVNDPETEVGHKKSNVTDAKSNAVDGRSKAVHEDDTKGQNNSILVIQSSNKAQTDMNKRTGSSVKTQQRTSKSCILL